MIHHAHTPRSTVPGSQPLGALLPTPSQRASLKKFIKLESQQVVVTFSSYFSSRCGVCTVAEGCWRGFYRFTVTDSSLGHCAVFNFYILFLVSYFFYLGLSGIPLTRYLPRSTQSTALWPVTKKSGLGAALVIARRWGASVRFGFSDC